MATSITGIAPLFDFTNESKFVIFTPYKGAGVNGNFHLIANTSGQGAWNTVGIFQDTTYDFSINAYVITVIEFSPSFRVFATGPSLETGSGSLEAYFGSETPYKVDFVFDSKSFQNNFPQGMAITTSPCIGNKTQIYAYTEPKSPDHESTTAVGAQILIDTTNNVTYTNPQVIQTQPSPTYGAVFNLGLQDSNVTINYRVVGLAGVSGNDYIDIALQTTCSTSCVPVIASGGVLPNGTAGVAYNHTIEVTGSAPLTLSSIVKPAWATVAISGTTISITGTPTVAATGETISFNLTSSCDTISFSDTFDITSGCTTPTITTQPVSDTSACDVASLPISVVATGTAPLTYQWFKADGTPVAGETSSTFNATVNDEYYVVVSNGCGDAMSTTSIVTIDQTPTVVSGGTMPTGTVGVPYNHTIVFSAGTQFVGVVSDYPWLTYSYAGTTLTLGGTPTVVATGANTEIIVEGPLIGCPLTLNLTSDVTAGCSPVGGGVINGNTLVVNGVTENYNISGLTGTGPFTYTWSVNNGVVVGGQGTDTAQIQMSANGTVVCSVTNCSGLYVLNLNKNVNLITADAVDDLQGVKTIGTAYNVDVATNDTPCDGGATTTYIISVGSESNVTINSVTGSVFNYTPTGTPFSFQYEIQCNGVTVDGATVSGTAVAACTNVSGGTIVGNTNVTLNVNENYTITGLSGTAPFTYLWNVTNGTIVSGQGTASIVVTPTGTGTALQCTVNNCSNSGAVTLTKNLNVKVNCTPTLYLNPTCFTVASMTGTLTGVAEPSRVIGFTPKTVTFTAAVGVHNYTFLLTDTNGVVHSVTFNNITC